jgi:hypothetical protein
MKRLMLVVLKKCMKNKKGDYLMKNKNKLFFGTALALLLVASAAQADIINGGFETGDFTGWTVTGFTGQNLSRDDTNHTTPNYLNNEAAGVPASTTNVVVNSLVSPAIYPTQGKFFAFISNENSTGTPLAGSAIRQTFTVGPGATVLSFDVQFLSAEVINSQWDFGGVALLDSSNNVITDFTLDHDPGTGTSPTNAHATANVAGGFADSTGWLSESFNLSALDGQTVTLLAYATNTGDQSVESRLLLDNVVEQGVPTTAVPEPATLLLLSSGLIGLAGYGREKFFKK